MLDSDATPDLNAMSKEELEALKRQVETALSKGEVSRRQDAVRAARQAVEEFGFTLEEILALAARSRAKRARFRNPENPEQVWSGRGRRPAWLNRQIEAGRSLDELRI